MYKKPLIAVGVIVIATIATHYVLFGSARYIGLTKAQPLIGAASQALGVGSQSSSMPSGSKDYNLGDTKYFSNGDWAVASIIPTKNSKLTQAVVIMQKREGVFQVVLGPGTAFDSSVTLNLPTDLGNYITQRGYVYAFSYR
ncbi:MAG: hypothetical protein ABI221_03070 [Candidatus Saccharimonadales bacterium]